MNASRPHPIQLGKVSGFPRAWEAVVARLPFMPKSWRADCPEREVESGELVKIKQPGGLTRITCVRGVLWITQEGDPTDYVLHQGETFRPQTRGSVLVEGLHASLIRLTAQES
ncbi:DUF2917 domain-containing protein [Verrucomicrobium spinosum]|uniref:DUF2917 domain-containing protein n=2 Tax=Verrucomicrobium spinosum TaxID=2736 RepID=UPI0001744E7D|nr:DUF2917 domain-containing protein [Verrucomicrobium spinosum]